VVASWSQHSYVYFRKDSNSILSFGLLYDLLPKPYKSAGFRAIMMTSLVF
jgi:hypothetical protein